MQIWIDGDACPNKIKEIVFRAAARTKTQLVIVANHFLCIPPSPFIKKIKVEAGFDAADTKIIDSMEKNDLVITADIPLAHAVIEKEGLALNPRGELYSEKNIKQVLAVRNLNESLRSSGLISGGAGKLSATDIHRFAQHLDQIITRFK